MNKITFIGDFANYACNKPIASFDLFDTLIRRRFLKANEVHDTVSAYALALTGRRTDSSPFDLTLLRYRMSDAMKSFDGTGTQEPLIDQVWNKILRGFVSDPQERARIVARVVAFELEVELTNLALVEGARDLLAKLKASGKILIAVSDMYFNKPTIERILTKLGIASLFDHLYVSAQSRLTKQTGDLFRLVLDDLRLDPAQVVHVGDNLRSDVAMATSAGLQAVHVEQEHLLQLERPRYGGRPRIEEEVADLTKLHLFSVLFDCCDSRADHLYFLARDGCAISRFLNRWNSALVARFLPPPAYSDLYLNRILTCWGGVDFSGEWLVQSIGLAFWLSHGEATWPELCRTLGIKNIPAALPGIRLRSDKDTFRVAKILQDEGLEDTVKDFVLAMRRQVIGHLDTIGFFNHRAAAFSDIGYSGTVMRDLNALFTNHLADEGDFVPPAMTLHLIAASDNYVQNRPRAFPFVRFSNQVVLPASELPEELKGSFAWLEFFFKHPTLQPLLNFVEQAGRVMPELRHEAAPEWPMPTDRVIELAPAREEDIVLLWMAAVDFKGPLIQPVINRFANPDHDLVDQMSDKVFEKHSINGARRSIILRIPGAKPDAIIVAAREGDYWIPGSILASHDAVALPAPGLDEAAPRNQRKHSLARRWSQLVGRPISQKVLPPIGSSGAFDLQFYRSFYPDLRQLTTDEALWHHYLVHGRKERRFGDRLALVAQLEAECGEVPDDFDGWNYLRRNPDLAGTVENADRALDHYMRHGRREGRQYRYDHVGLSLEFEKLAACGTILLDEPEARGHLAGASVMELYLRRYRLWPGPWIDAIDVAEFRALHRVWCGPVATKAEAVVALLERGVERMPALSLSWTFDLEFYRQQALFPASLADSAVYLHMLGEGASKGLAPSESAALKRLWGETEYPACFEWSKFATSLGRTPNQAERVELLRKFIDRPGIDRLKFVSGAADAGSFTVFLGNHAWRQGGRHDEARQLFEQALADGANPVRINHLLGDLLLEMGQRGEALTFFRKGSQYGAADLWSFYHHARMLIEDGDYLSALAVLAKCREQWQERAPWRRLHHRAMQMRSQSVLRLIQSSPPGSPDLSGFDEMMHDIAAMLPAPTQWASHIGGALVLTMRPASSARRDRIAAPAITVYDMLSVEQEDYLSAMLAHDTVIFHEVPLTYDVLRAIALARSLGKRTIAWLGDLADWQGLPLARCSWGERGDSTSPFGLAQCPELILPARACDAVVTTLAGCVPLLAELAPKVPRELLAIMPLDTRRADRSWRDVVVVPVGTARSVDITALARALGDAADIDPKLRFLIDSRLAQEPALARMVSRWCLLAPDISLCALAEAIAVADAVVQIVRDPTRQYAAWAEAAAGGVRAMIMRETPPPVVASGRKRVERPALADWPVGLPEPIMPSELAGILAAAAGRSPVPTPLGNLRQIAAPARVARRQRILFVNVFFAPQTIGGATRVLKDNIDYILDHHHDEFELAVVAGDEQNDRTGEWRIDSYRGIPVVRIATAQEINMDWRPVNLQAGARFAAVLDSFQPDLVHIHCLQRLSVTIAEVCQARAIPHFVTLHDGWWISDFPFLVNEHGTYTPPMADFTAQDGLANVTADISWRRAGRLRQALLGATRRLAVSRTFASIYQSCGIPCEVIENGTSRIHPLPRSAPVGQLVQLCHVGGLEHHKGAYLIEAALRGNRFDNLHFTVVDLARGPGDETHTFWGSTPVTITGKMSTTELAKFYARMHVLLAPSTWPESYGLVTREALAHGLWVIASDMGAIGEPVEMGRNGFVVSVADTIGLAEVLAAIDSDPAKYQQSPKTPAPQRLADDQSRELVTLYREYIGMSSLIKPGVAAREPAIAL